MLSSTLFYVFIGILTLSFLVNKMIDRLNAKHFDDEITLLSPWWKLAKGDGNNTSLHLFMMFLYFLTKTQRLC